MDTQAIGKFIRKKRLEKNMTQKTLAGLLYVTPAAVSKWEKGINCPDLQNLQTLSAALEFSLDELTDPAESSESLISAEPPEALPPAEPEIERVYSPKPLRRAALRIFLAAILIAATSIVSIGLYARSHRNELDKFSILCSYYGTYGEWDAYYIIVTCDEPIDYDDAYSFDNFILTQYCDYFLRVDAIVTIYFRENEESNYDLSQPLFENCLLAPPTRSASSSGPIAS